MTPEQINRMTVLPLWISIAQANAEAYFAEAATLKDRAEKLQDMGMEAYARENTLRDELEALMKLKEKP